MKRVITFLLVFVVFLVLSFDVYADPGGASPVKQQKIFVAIKPDITIELNGDKQKITDVNGRTVYPVIYGGSTYLPIRAISELIHKSIEWDSASKTVFVGKTISNPNGSGNVPVTQRASTNQISPGIGSKPQYVEAYLKPDILIMYDFVPQSFADANRKTVYPIIYNGTTYLPVRGISQMMDKTIEWDPLTKIICIDDYEGNEEVTEENDETTADKEDSILIKNLKSFFEKEELLYYEATSKTTNIKTAASLEEKQKIAAKISADLKSAENISLEIQLMDTSQFTEKQLDAYNKTKAFTESTEYYILILENIAYLAAQDSDYSMLAETFLYFATDSQTKMEEARNALQGLN